MIEDINILQWRMRPPTPPPAEPVQPEGSTGSETIEEGEEAEEGEAEEEGDKADSDDEEEEEEERELPTIQELVGEIEGYCQRLRDLAVEVGSTLRRSIDASRVTAHLWSNIAYLDLHCRRIVVLRPWSFTWAIEVVFWKGVASKGFEPQWTLVCWAQRTGRSKKNCGVGDRCRLELTDREDTEIRKRKNKSDG